MLPRYPVPFSLPGGDLCLEAREKVMNAMPFPRSKQLSLFDIMIRLHCYQLHLESSPFDDNLNASESEHHKRWFWQVGLVLWVSESLPNIDVLMHLGADGSGGQKMGEEAIVKMSVITPTWCAVCLYLLDVFLRLAVNLSQKKSLRLLINHHTFASLCFSFSTEGLGW